MPASETRTDVPLPDRYVVYAADAVEDLLNSQQPDGHFETGSHYTPFSPVGQAGIYALAWLHLTPHPLNPFHGDERLLDSVMRCADCLVKNMGDDGKFHYDSGGYEVHHFDQWLGLMWLETFLLLRDRLDDRRRNAWQDALTKGSQLLFDWIVEVNEQDKFHTRSFQTSPNHAATRAGFLYYTGKVFGRSEWCDAVDAFMVKFLKLQDADGFWPEYEGPVMGYARVTLSGVGLYHELSGDAASREALERSCALFARIMPAHGGPALVFDGRQQHPWWQSAWGNFALSLTSEGRGLCDAMTANRPAKAPGGHDISRAIESFNRWHHGPASPPPFHEGQFVHRLKQPGGVHREAPWSWALSGITAPLFKEGPFSLERQTLLTLWRDEAECIINGANSKEHFEGATFQSSRMPDDALPVEATLDDEVSQLVATYRTFTGEIAMTSTGDVGVEIAASVRDLAEGDAIAFRLQLGAKHEDVITIDGQERKIGDDDWSVDDVREVAFGTVRMTFDRPARLWWPFRGYNSYTKDHTFPDLHSARLIAETMLDGEAPVTTITVRAR